MCLQHTIQSGECLSHVAVRYGWYWRALWQHPANQSLQERRSSPHVLFAGDVVCIPELRLKREECATERRHRFRRLGVPLLLRLRLLEDGQPIEREPFRIRLDDGTTIEGKTTAKGVIEVKVHPQVRSAHLKVGGGMAYQEYDLRIGDLDPATESSGVKQRLQNLGFLLDGVDATSEESESAKALYGRKRGADALNRIKENHGI